VEAMDKVIVTGLLIIGSVTAAVLVIITITPSISGTSQSIMESSGAASNRIKTDIEVIAVATNSDGTRVDAWIKNVGVARIQTVSLSDVFLVTPGIRFDAMSYAPTGDNTWIEDPVGAPWSRGDTLHVTITLPAANSLGAGDHILKFSTSNGVPAERVFSR